MSKYDAFFERSLMALVTRVPAPGVAALALSLYGGVGLALPLALDLSAFGLVVANVLGTSLAGLVGLAWLFALAQARDRRHLVEWTTNLRLLTAEEFEWLVGEVFRREGWEVRETGRQDAPDGSIDLDLSRGNDRRIAQCKRWGSWQVRVDDIRQFAGTLMREGLPGSAGIFVTLSDFGKQARAEAEKIGLQLVDGRELHERVEKVRRAEPCPECQAPMRFDRSELGWWFRCVTDGCQGKRDLGDDVGRAVDLLTQPP